MKYSAIKRMALALIATMSCGAVFAQATANDTNMKAITDQVKTWLDGIVATFSGFFTDNFTTIVAVLSFAVGVTVLWVIYRFFTKGAKKIG